VNRGAVVEELHPFSVTTGVNSRAYLLPLRFLSQYFYSPYINHCCITNISSLSLPFPSR
jgi:hypothetical protein